MIALPDSLGGHVSEDGDQAFCIILSNAIFANRPLKKGQLKESNVGNNSTSSIQDPNQHRASSHPTK